MKNILITGAAGFIGSNLAQNLLTEGHIVTGIDNFITGTQKNIKRLEGNKKFRFIKADIADPGKEAVQKLINDKYNEIYHLACPTGVPNLVTLSEEMLLTCSMGTKNILEIAKASRAKFLFTSSSEVYGDPLVFPQGENYTGNVDPIGIRSPYEEGKRFSESLTIMYVRRYGVSGKIVRVFNTYGPNMSEKDLRVIPRFLEQIKSRIPLTLHGDGSQRRTFCYIDDLIVGLLLVMKKGGSGEVYNLGSDQEITMLQLAQLVKDVTGSKVTIDNVKRPSHDHSARLPNLEKIHKLGWKQKTPLERGLQKTHRFILQGLKNPVYNL